jgi:type II secretory pathway component PulK
MGDSPGDATAIVNCILDWIDVDDQPHVEGAETEYYQTLTPPYAAKNGPLDDISELLLIKGMTPQIYYGISATNYQPSYYSQQRNRFGQQAAPMPTAMVGMTDLFTPLSDGKININTAPAEVLQLLPGIDPMIAEAIINGRAGEADVTAPGMVGPYRSVGDLQRLPAYEHAQSILRHAQQDFPGAGGRGRGRLQTHLFRRAGAQQPARRADSQLLLEVAGASG